MYIYSYFNGTVFIGIISIRAFNKQSRLQIRCVCICVSECILVCVRVCVCLVLIFTTAQNFVTLVLNLFGYCSQLVVSKACGIGVFCPICVQLKLCTTNIVNLTCIGHILDLATIGSLIEQFGRLFLRYNKVGVFVCQIFAGRVKRNSS